MNRRNVLVTGGGKNIGKAISVYFAQQGYDVYITGRNLEATKENALALNERFPDVTVRGYELEMSNVDSIRTLFAALEKDAGKLDVLVCNAADLGIDLDVYNTTEEDFDRLFDTNVKGTFFCVQEAAKLMIPNRSGSIVLMSSIQSKGAVEGRTIYSATKGAVNTLNRNLAYDLAPYGIRVNTVIAGAVHSDRWDSQDPSITLERRKNYPAGRESSQEEIAGAVYYLASEASATMTGSELTMDCGVSLSMLPYRDRKNHVGG